MPDPDSGLDLDALARARSLLTPRTTPPPVWPALGAAALLAVSALVFATAMLLAPPLTSEHVARERGVE
jgi:hypothetical protein